MTPRGSSSASPPATSRHRSHRGQGGGEQGQDSETGAHDPGTVAHGAGFRDVSARVARFTRAELEAFYDAEVPDLLPGPGQPLKLLFVGINPGLWTAAVQTHFARPGNRFYPALLAAGIIDRPVDAGAGHDRRGPRLLPVPRHRDHQRRPPGDRPCRRADRRRAPRRRPPAGRDGRADPAGGRGGRRHHGVPRGVLGCPRRRPGRSRSRWPAPSCGSCRTRAGSTPTTRSTRSRRRTATPPGPRA